jgi:hypothetical protein
MLVLIIRAAKPTYNGEGRLVVGTHDLAPGARTDDLWNFRLEGSRIAQERHHRAAFYGIR